MARMEGRLYGWVMRLAAGMMLGLFGTGAALAGERGVTRMTAEADRLIPEEAQIETLAEGFLWSEGPVWLASQNRLLFSDVPANTIYEWRPGQGHGVFLSPSGIGDADPEIFREPGSNGLILAPDGHVLMGDHGNRAIARLDPVSKEKSLLITHYDGKRFNSPNDLVRRSDGWIYFTDPPYGLKDLEASPHREQSVNGVYRFKPGGEAQLLDGTLTKPNGIALSPDERTLYVAVSDPAKTFIRAYDLDADGQVLGSREFYDATPRLRAGHQGLMDGMAVDTEGRIYATGPGGVLVLTPDGQLIAVINPGSRVANCAFGEDGQTLFMTAHYQLTRIRLSATGLGMAP